MTGPEPIGFMVATAGDAQVWDTDWDGVLYADRESAEAELAVAVEAGWRSMVVAVVPVGDPIDPPGQV